MQEFKSFEEFWPYYVGEHSRVGCRVLHYFGTSLALASFVAFVVTGRYHLVPLSLLLGYGPAWVGHFFIERNRPATFKYPRWSFLGDFRMLAYGLTGRMGRELERAKSLGFGARPELAG